METNELLAIAHRVVELPQPKTLADHMEWARLLKPTGQSQYTVSPIQGGCTLRNVADLARDIGAVTTLSEDCEPQRSRALDRMTEELRFTLAQIGNGVRDWIVENVGRLASARLVRRAEIRAEMDRLQGELELLRVELLGVSDGD